MHGQCARVITYLISAGAAILYIRHGMAKESALSRVASLLAARWRPCFSRPLRLR